ncbi:MAG: SCO family protein [Candidatus Baltobacteraceae bacterium]
MKARAVLVAALAVAIGVSLAVSLTAFLSNRDRAPDFTLVDQDRRPFTLSAQRGRVVLLFFGYAHCPDVCPTTLANLEHAIASLGPAGRGVEVAFVTVDAKRDTPEALKSYVEVFGSNVTGLTGSAAVLERVYAAYHVFHQELPQQPGESTYYVAHSSAVYYIDRSGRMSGLGDWTENPAAILRRLRPLTA